MCDDTLPVVDREHPETLADQEGEVLLDSHVGGPGGHEEGLEEGLAVDHEGAHEVDLGGHDVVGGHTPLAPGVEDRAADTDSCMDLELKRARYRREGGRGEERCHADCFHCHKYSNRHWQKTTVNYFRRSITGEVCNLMYHPFYKPPTFIYGTSLFTQPPIEDQ